ncbi:MAG: SDR family oxidoreductase, partial [Nanoarchaeota archaeon]
VDSDPEEFITRHEKAVNLMLNAVVYASKLGLDMLMESNGVIINISSDAGLEKKVYPNQVPYHSAKAGVNHATRAIDLETRSKGVRAFAIAPGNIDTPLLRKTIEGDSDLVELIEQKAGSLDRFYGKILKPKDVADRVMNIVQNPDRYPNPVIEMESFEF